MNVIITGFGSFAGVEHNPTIEVVKNLIEMKDLKYSIEHSEILSVDVATCNEFVQRMQIHQSTLFIHLGVHKGATKLILESCAYNNMSFTSPDQSGFRPSQVKINEDKDLDHELITAIPITKIFNILLNEGYNCMASKDPGRYLCNYIYYKSLQRSDSDSDSEVKAYSLFIHVPPFTQIPLSEQVQFVNRTIEVILSELSYQ